jgi:hypothetical protein
MLEVIANRIRTLAVVVGITGFAITAALVWIGLALRCAG